MRQKPATSLKVALLQCVFHFFKIVQMVPNLVTNHMCYTFYIGSV